MADKKKKSMAYPVIFMLVLTGILTLALAFINQKAEPKIEFNKDIELKQKILYVFDVVPEDATPENIDKTFNELVTEADKQFNDKPVYLLKENGEDKAYAVPFTGPGLWGSIEGYLGINKDMKTVTGIEFIKQDETPGLGGRIAEPEYKEQYRSLDISNPVGGEIVINKPAEGGNVDAIAGATQTSSFVTKMLNKDIQDFINSWGGNQ